MSVEPMASGAKGPAPWPMTVHAMVRTRKKVPINSATYLFINNLLRLSIERLQRTAICGRPRGHSRAPYLCEGLENRANRGVGVALTRMSKKQSIAVF